MGSPSAILKSSLVVQILRALFLVNDKCSSEGLVWRPRRCVLMPHIPHLTTEGDTMAETCPFRQEALVHPLRSGIICIMHGSYRVVVDICIDVMGQSTPSVVRNAELRGGGCGRPLMRVYSKGCTVPGYGSPPAWANRQPRRTTGAFCAPVSLVATAAL